MAILLFYFSSSNNIGNEQKRKRDSIDTINVSPARRISRVRPVCGSLEDLGRNLVNKLLGIPSAVNRRIARLELGRYIYDVILGTSRKRLSDGDSDSGSVSRMTEIVAIRGMEGDDDEYVRYFVQNMVEEIKRIPNEGDRERVRLKVHTYIFRKKTADAETDADNAIVQKIMEIEQADQIVNADHINREIAPKVNIHEPNVLSFLTQNRGDQAHTNSDADNAIAQTAREIEQANKNVNFD